MAVRFRPAAGGRSPSGASAGLSCADSPLCSTYAPLIAERQSGGDRVRRREVGRPVLWARGRGEYRSFLMPMFYLDGTKYIARCVFHGR